MTEDKRYNSVVVLGPTAVGKTSIGVQIALNFNGEIISADSRQTYRGLDIGSGKDLCEYTVGSKKIEYHLIDVADVNEEYNVFNFQQDFYKIFPQIIERKKLPVIVGGTGMYIDSVVRSYDLVDIPENTELREKLQDKTQEELAEILKSLKPELHNKCDLVERERTIRAIEIQEGLKSSEIKKFRNQTASRPDIRPLIIGTTFSRDLVRENISRRLKERLENGLIEEVESLHKNGTSFIRLEKLGLEYKYCALYLQGKIKDKDELYEKLFVAIRQFAKRQETWFRFMEKNGVEIFWLKEVQDKTERINEALNFVGKYFPHI